MEPGEPRHATNEPMTRLPVPLVATLLLSTFACSEPDAPPAVPGQGLACRRPVEDFGTVFEGQVLEHEFEVRLTVPAALDAPRTDCGCTVASLEVARDGGRTTYEPGTPLAADTRLFVGARFDSRGRPGLAQRSVTLTGAGTPLALTLVADVREYLVAEPRTLAYERFLEGQGAERRFRVTSVDGERFGLRATGRAIPPSVTVTATPAGPDADGRSARWDVLVRLGGDTPVGPHSYPIELESDLAVPGVADRRFAVAPVWSLQVLGPVALSTPSLEFGLVRPDEVVARTVRLESFDPDFTLRDPSATLEAVSWAGAPEGFPLGRTAHVTARRAADGRTCDFEVTLDGLDPAVQGTFLAQLLVETGHPDLPRLSAVVRGVRAPDPIGVPGPGPAGRPGSRTGAVGGGESP